MSDNGNKRNETARRTTEDQARAWDIETARQFYAEVLALSLRMDLEGNRMSNRGLWYQAARHITKACDLIEQFIGYRMTADVRETHAKAVDMATPDPRDEDGFYPE